MTPSDWKDLLVTGTFCLFIVVVTGVLLVGLYDTSVNNEDIFKMLTPPFSGVFGYFMGRREKT